jgi:hypothetical protein
MFSRTFALQEQRPGTDLLSADSRCNAILEHSQRSFEQPVLMDKGIASKYQREIDHNKDTLYQMTY